MFLAALSLKTVTFSGTRDYSFNREVLGEHGSARKRYLICARWLGKWSNFEAPPADVHKVGNPLHTTLFTDSQAFIVGQRP